MVSISAWGALAPGVSSKINLAYDHLAVVAAVALSTLASSGAHRLAEPAVWGFAAAALFVWAVGSGALQLYDPWTHRGLLYELALLSLLVTAQMLLLAMARALVPDGTSVLPEPSTLFLILLPAQGVARLLVFRPLATREDPIDDVLIIGTGPSARQTGERLERHHPRRRVLGYLRPSAPSRMQIPPERDLGTVGEDLERILRSHPVGEVYVALRASQHEADVETVIRTCERLGIPFALPAVPVPLGRSWPAAPDSIADGFLHFVPFESCPAQRAAKRLFDIIASGLALVVLSPLLLTVALAIKLTSRGSVFFPQERVGLHGRRFKMLKFRSMVENAEGLKAKLAAHNEQTGPVFKMKNDPRITPIGRLIRKFSIDELPQLINVMRGDMSIVGPRPPVPQEVARYEAWQLRRLSVRPGLTCIWQVSGRSQISFEEWMYLDMRYIDHWSFWSDLVLILRTVPAVLSGRGAS
jgi:exopolysaccharide biosynthesis polyprenyl glycosylphosphotransferase